MDAGLMPESAGDSLNAKWYNKAIVEIENMRLEG